MIHHVSFGTSDAVRAKTFYDPMMAVIGFRCLSANRRAVDYGVGEIMFSLETPLDGAPASVGNGAHVAFLAHDRAMVNALYETAIAQGGSCDGKPGLRPEYDANDYAAFVRDPDGNKIEAMTFSAT